MPATRFKVWAVGSAVGGAGVTGSIHVGVAGIAKTNSANLPHVVLNELVCANLARVLFLPTPPGFIIEHNAKPHYVSLNFNLAGQDLPPANPAAVVAAQPLLAAGAVAFDCWVVNPDRHRGNLAFDATTQRLQIFDHSHAFYGSEGFAHLAIHENDLGINHLNLHCLAPHIISADDLKYWCDRAKSIPDYYIEALINSTLSLSR